MVFFWRRYCIISAYVLAVLLILLLPLPAFAVDHGYNGGANYAGVQWRFSSRDAGGVQCIAGVCGGDGLKAQNDLWVTVRTNNAITCDEHIDFSHNGFSYPGKWYYLCGQPAIITGNPPRYTMRAYYHAPNGTEGWVDSPAHCGLNGCDHFWYVNWLVISKNFEHSAIARRLG